MSNTGTAPTSGTVTAVDPPTGFTVTAISGTNWMCTLTTTTCTYSNSVGAGQSFPPIKVTGNVTAPNGTPVSIPLSLSGGGASAVNVTPTPTVNVAAVALGITKSHIGNFTQSQTGATCTVKVSNGAGAGATSGTVTVTEMPPSGGGLTVTGMAGTNWACTVATLTCTRSDSLAGGSSYDQITVTVNVSATATSPQVNAVMVSGGGSPSANANDATSIDPGGVSPCPLPTLGSENLLNGTFTAFFRGWNDSPAGTFQFASAFVTDGAGLITGGELDLGAVSVGVTSQSPPVLASITSGCYQLGPDRRGLMTWSLTGGRGPVTFAFSVRADGLGNLIEFDDANPRTTPGTRGAGTIVKQGGGPFTQVPSGPWAFGLTGYSPNGSNSDYLLSGAIGRYDNSAVGVVSNGAADVAFTNGGPGTQTNVDNQSFTGSSTAPDSLGRGTLTLNFANFNGQGPLTLNFAYYIVDPTDFWLQSIDTPDNNGHSLENGGGAEQDPTFGLDSLNGNVVFQLSGADLSSTHSFTVNAIGQFNSDSLGGVSVKLDEVSNGNVVATGTNTIPGGTYTISPNGMGVLTIGTGSTAKSFSFAMDAWNYGSLLEGTQASPGGNVLTGTFQQQTGGSFNDGTFSGLHNFGSRMASAKSALEVGSVTATSATNPASLSGKTDQSSGAGCNTGCVAIDQPTSATYSVGANGRIVITFGAGTGGRTTVGWLARRGGLMLSDTSDANGTILAVR